MNPMQDIRIGKLTLNVGAGKDQKKLDNGLKLLETISGKKPTKTYTDKRIAGWGLRPGLPIGCKVTVRREEAKKLLTRLLGAKDNKLKPRQFDNNGSLSFGIAEYIDVPETKYDPELGIMGFEVCVTLERPGFRIKRRRLKKRSVGHSHKINQDDAIKFMKENFKVKMGDEQ